MTLSGEAPQPYPANWEQVAELRVFRTSPDRWEKLIRWRKDMQHRGWRLLKVSDQQGEMVAVFGRTKEELLVKKELSQ